MGNSAGAHDWLAYTRTLFHVAKRCRNANYIELIAAYKILAITLMYLSDLRCIMFAPFCHSTTTIAGFPASLYTCFRSLPQRSFPPQLYKRRTVSRAQPRNKSTHVGHQKSTRLNTHRYLAIHFAVCAVIARKSAAACPSRPPELPRRHILNW